MTSGPIAVEWLNQNSLRSYPFKEDAGLRPVDSAGNLVDGGWTLPPYLVTDIVISVSGSHYDPIVYLKRISVVARTIGIVLADSQGEEVISVSAKEEGHVLNRAYQMAGVGSFSDARGVICLGDLTRFFDETPEGVYEFLPSEAQVEPTCIRPSASGVRTIRTIDAAGYTTEGLVGDVSLVAGQNIRIDVYKAANAIKISADPNSGYSEGCPCDAASDGFVRSINGIRTEDVTIVGDDCVSVGVSDGIIRVSDTCAKPCCGCAEVTAINNIINNLSTQVSQNESNVATLGNRLTDFVTSYLLARKTLG